MESGGRAANFTPEISGKPMDRSRTCSRTGPLPRTISFNSIPSAGKLAYTRFHLPLRLNRASDGLPSNFPLAHESRISFSGVSTARVRACLGDAMCRRRVRESPVVEFSSTSAVGGGKGKVGASCWRNSQVIQSGMTPSSLARVGVEPTNCAVQLSARAALLAHTALPVSASSVYRRALGLGCFAL